MKRIEQYLKHNNIPHLMTQYNVVYVYGDLNEKDFREQCKFGSFDILHFENVNGPYIKIVVKSFEKDKDKKTKRTKRIIKVPLSYCKDIKHFNNDEIESLNYYNIVLDGHEYIVDIMCTTNKQYYVRIVDITNGYISIDFNEFKAKYVQPNLFDDFFNI